MSQLNRVLEKHFANKNSPMHETENKKKKVIEFVFEILDLVKKIMKFKFWKKLV